ncbi:MAG: NADH-quinone oxidoreductase subunit E [Pseudomonadota bacterium]
MQRRLHHKQPESFSFTPANARWAAEQIKKYPEGRQASAVIPLLWRAQEQEGWVSRPAIEQVARMLDMASIRVLEVATFYFMFQLQPVGTAAHIQICGTTSCMICGAEDLVAVCKQKIAPNPHQLSEDGKLSWEEVECLGACSNAPMAQIGKDYYEDLTAKKFGEMIDEFRAGKVPTPGPQNGRWASEPVTGLTSLKGEAAESANASIYLATELGETVKRIDGTERTASDLIGARQGAAARKAAPAPEAEAEVAKPTPSGQEAMELHAEETIARPAGDATTAEDAAPVAEDKPTLLQTARDGQPDDLKRIKGVGPKLEGVLNDMGIWHFDQIAAWTPAEVAWVDTRLKFKGRIERDDWIAQATELAKEKGDA